MTCSHTRVSFKRTGKIQKYDSLSIVPTYDRHVMNKSHSTMASQIGPGNDHEEPSMRFSHHMPDDFFDDNQGSKKGHITHMAHLTVALLDHE